VGKEDQNKKDVVIGKEMSRKSKKEGGKRGEGLPQKRRSKSNNSKAGLAQSCNWRDRERGKMSRIQSEEDKPGKPFRGGVKGEKKE